MVQTTAKTTPAGMVFVLLQEAPMNPKPQKPSLFANPFAAWTQFAFKLWGFGRPEEKEEISVAVIPTSDAQAPRPPKRTKKTKARVKAKYKSKRASR